MNLINKLPNLNWSDVALEEIGLTGEELIEKSEHAWQIGDIAVVGLIYTSYISPPWFWMALTKYVGMKELLDFRRRAHLIPPGTRTLVNTANDTLARFAELYGFVATGDIVKQHGRIYKVMRRG